MTALLTMLHRWCAEQLLALMGRVAWLSDHRPGAMAAILAWLMALGWTLAAIAIAFATWGAINWALTLWVQTQINTGRTTIP